MPHPSASLFVSLLLAVVTLLPHEGRTQDAAGEIALSDESMQLRYLLSGGGSAANPASELGFGLFLNENRDIVINTHYYVAANRLRFDRLTFKVGPVAYAALLSTENTDVFGVALAVETRFEFLRRQQLFVVARLAYAPDILTFGSADNLTDLTAQVELPLTDRVVGFAGYRLLEFDLLEGTREIEESLHLGIRYRF
jgi:hypothetical protein